MWIRDIMDHVLERIHDINATYNPHMFPHDRFLHMKTSVQIQHLFQVEASFNIMEIAQNKTIISPLLIHWSYRSRALSNRRCQFTKQENIV